MKNVQPVDGLAPSTVSSGVQQPPAKFEVGRVVATPSALRLLESAGISPLALMARHVSGNWGDCDRHDADANEQALQSGARLFSVYRLVDAAWLKTMPRSERAQLPTIWIITEATDENGSRASTAVLRPEDY